MNSKQRAVLEAVFATPVPANIPWAAIEGLLLSVGCEAIEGRGPRVQFVKGAARANFHRPHPGKEAKRYQVRDARAFLTTLGVTP